MTRNGDPAGARARIEARVERLLNDVRWDHPEVVRAKLTASSAKLAELEDILLDGPSDGKEWTARKTTDG